MPGSALAPVDPPIPWRAIFQRLSLAYHWTPDEILALTPAQLTLYLQDDIAPEGAVAMNVQQGMEYVACHRAARESWIDEVLSRQVNVRKNVPAPRELNAASPNSLIAQSAPKAPAPHQATPHAIQQFASTRNHHRADFMPASTQARRSIAVVQDGARRTETLDPMRPGELARNSSPTASGFVERTAHRLRDTAAGKLEELTHRVEMIAETTSETQAAIQRLERRRNDAAQFS